MSKFFVELWLDGYENEEAREQAEYEFIRNQLDFTASSVRIVSLPDNYEPNQISK